MYNNTYSKTILCGQITGEVQIKTFPNGDVLQMVLRTERLGKKLSETATEREILKDFHLVEVSGKPGTFQNLHDKGMLHWGTRVMVEGTPISQKTETGYIHKIRVQRQNFSIQNVYQGDDVAKTPYQAEPIPNLPPVNAGDFEDDIPF